MSYRNDTDASYDRSLLSKVPDPTRAEKQEGYNVDLLDEGRERRARSPPVPNRQPTDQQPLTDGHTPAPVADPHKEGGLENGAEPAVAKGGRWYRTRWGITAIVIIIILIIGGIVGGVVGGTHHSSSKATTNGTLGGNPNPNSNDTFGGTNSTSTVTGANTVPNPSGSTAAVSGPDQTQGQGTIGVTGGRPQSTQR